MSKTEQRSNFPIESLLSARQLLQPQIDGDMVYFISNMSGMYSLFSMKRGGSIPVPLLPEGIALQNPHLIMGANFDLFPKLNKIIVLIDNNGDELYQPCLIPMDGGIPESIFNDKFAGMQVIYFYGDIDRNDIYFSVDTRKEPGIELFQYNLETKVLRSFGKTAYGKYFSGISEDRSKILYTEGYGPNDTCVYYHDVESKEENVVIGTPISQRESGKQYVKNGVNKMFFVENDDVLIFASILDSDLGSINWLKLSEPTKVNKLEVVGLEMEIQSEINGFKKLEGNQFSLQYNVNGETSYYLAEYRNDNGTRLLKQRILELSILKFLMREC
ncbi:MAG: hypothetical protein ACW99A_05870 [Candidatus Kariarchaeaceae archaeon]|jgi:hypothetical protein